MVAVKFFVVTPAKHRLLLKWHDSEGVSAASVKISTYVIKIIREEAIEINKAAAWTQRAGNEISPVQLNEAS